MCFWKLWKKTKKQKVKLKSGQKQDNKETIEADSTGSKINMLKGKNSSDNAGTKDEENAKHKGKISNLEDSGEANSDNDNLLQCGEDEKPPEIAAYTTGSLKLIPSNCQDIGARERQEDSFAFSDLSDKEFVDNNGVLAVVADGMGGLARGDRASQVAVSTFLREYNQKNGDDPPVQFLKRTLNIANYAVFDLALDENDAEVDLGTTLVAAAVHKGKMHWVAAGDSLIYLLRGNKLEQLNKEHIYANQLAVDVENGFITKKEADQHPERGYLTSYLGMSELSEMDYSDEPVNLEPGNVLLLCSDGLTNTLSEQEIMEILSSESLNAAEELVEKALSKKQRHQDNITVLVLNCISVEDKIDQKEDKTDQKGDENEE